MAKLTYEESVQKGIEHIGGRGSVPWIERKLLPGGVWGEMENKADICLHLINTNTGSPVGCIRSLATHAECVGLLAWFRDRNLHDFKQWFYVSAKLKRMADQLEQWPCPAMNHFCPLLSDHDDLIRWFAQCTESPFPLDAEKVNALGSFLGMQMLLALRGDWERVVQRSEAVLAAEPPRQKKYLIDYRFYIALARGDVPQMESILAELTSPKIARVRNNEFEFGLTEHFISTWGVIYAKLAWRHGYQVQVDTPWVPKEWLPIAPLPVYEDPYPFMRGFDIWQPLK